MGEISPDEFKHFIGKDIRLEPVVIGKDQTIEQILEFYMGKNTPDRQVFILENLVVEDQDINKKEVLDEAEL
ncbi:DNA topoisomerase IV subunit B [compost metagenome]